MPCYLPPIKEIKIFLNKMPEKDCNFIPVLISIFTPLWVKTLLLQMLFKVKQKLFLK